MESQTNPRQERTEREAWSVSDVAVDVTEDGFFLRFCNKRIPISGDEVFVLGSLFGCYDPFDGGRDFATGERLVFTRQVLLEGAYGAGWRRYARAQVERSGTRGLPFRIRGLPRLRSGFTAR